MPVSGELPLEGLRIIDMTTNLAGPFCGQMLGDFGADVIKLESPLTNGDMTRKLGPMHKDSVSWHFQNVNRNKRSIAVDIGQTEGQEIFLKLLEDADILIENTKTGSLEKFGLGYDQCLKERFPTLIHCAISGFGRTGPYAKYPGYDPVGQAYGGLMSLNGEVDGDPLRCAFYISDVSTGLHACVGILLALQERNKSGLGQQIDLALVDCTQVLQQQFVSHWLGGGDDYKPKRLGNQYPGATPAEIFKTGDGHITLLAARRPHFAMLCELIGRPELVTDSRYATLKARNNNRLELKADLEQSFKDLEAETLAEQLLEKGIPAAAILDIPSAMQHKQAKAREMLIDQDGFRGQGFAIKMSRTPAKISAAAPRFGEHNRSILHTLGLSDAEIDHLETRQIIAEVATNNH
ncbi:MAG: CoA transferase [Pseudomonadales bacterium]|nr:CoA transferase [Pseudomonadales bacterium]